MRVVSHSMRRLAQPIDKIGKNNNNNNNNDIPICTTREMTQCDSQFAQCDNIGAIRRTTCSYRSSNSCGIYMQFVDTFVTVLDNALRP